VTKDAERRIRAGHPWVFDGSIRSTKPGGPGDLAVIFDHDRRFLGIGLYDPRSAIAVRILHVGDPLPVDDAWLHDAIDRSRQRRAPLFEREDTTAYRLVHGENDGLGGLVVDQYEDDIVVKLYTSAWLPWLPYLTAAIASQTECDNMILRLGRQVVVDETARSSGPRQGDGTVIHGPGHDGPVTFRENGLRFQTDLFKGHKTGHFLDQRDNRQLIRALSADRRVLDVFACTGGFSVHAAAGGASSVTSVDSSRPALALARANMALNRQRIGEVEHRLEAGDAFTVLDDLQGQRFDLIVLDPPAFAHRQRQVPGALRAYQRLTALAAPLLESGGLLFQASCSSRISESDLIDAISRGLGRRGWTERQRLGQPIDHPIGFEHGAYLKALLVELD